MPLFDIACPACGATSEVLARAADPVVCPACGSPEARRLVAQVAAPGTSRALAAAGREAARKAGHLSHFKGG
ncbi:MAG TPA: zinc ribbon domain-containing protein [Novosphingobium sp.]|nr:zinc ribbon domain-containing protein [Novosphingobium sp.]